VKIAESGDGDGVNAKSTTSSPIPEKSLDEAVIPSPVDAENLSIKNEAKEIEHEVHK